MSEYKHIKKEMEEQRAIEEEYKKQELEAFKMDQEQVPLSSFPSCFSSPLHKLFFLLMQQPAEQGAHQLQNGRNRDEETGQATEASRGSKTAAVEADSA